MASLKPPFTAATAAQKVKAAQNLWNTKDPVRIALAYTPETIWRNRSTFVQGQHNVQKFLAAKFARERGYRLRKELFAFTDNRIAVQFWYEYWESDDVDVAAGGSASKEGESAAMSPKMLGWGSGRWKRCYGLEDWTFDEEGKMRKRMMSGNEIVIGESERWFGEDVEDVDSVEISEEHW